MAYQETLTAALEVKGYALELADAERIIAEVVELMSKLTPDDVPELNHYYWAAEIIRPDRQCGLIWDPNNVYYFYSLLGRPVPEWYHQKYSQYSALTTLPNYN